MDGNPSPSLKTPVAGAKSTLSEVTVIDMNGSSQTIKLEAVDLDIKNLEGTPKTKHKKAASVSGSPSSKTRTHMRKYSLDLTPSGNVDHAALAAENEKKRKGSERMFKIMVIILILIVIGLITGLMMAWEMGYLNKLDGFSAPVFY